MIQCTARIRPFPNDTEIACEKPMFHEDGEHVGVLRDYAYPGSETKITWFEHDRRNFRNEWPGVCVITLGCVLPSEHPGACAK